MREIVLQNRSLRVRVNLDQGAEISHLENAAGENMLFFPEWRTPLPASESAGYGNAVTDWLSDYRGGWQELFPNAGNPCDVMGTPLPFHGEVSRGKWAADVHVEGMDVTVSCGARLPLVVSRRMRLDPKEPILFIEETVHNESALEVPYLWGHHPAFGPPLAAPGARIDLPAGRLSVDAGMEGSAVDLLPGSTHRWGEVKDRKGAAVDLTTVPAGPVQRLCYIEELAGGWYAIRNPANGLGAALSWDLETFPHLWFWQEIGGSLGMPWYGRGAVTALEPATQFPSYGLAEAVKAGTAHTLAPGASATTSLTFRLFAADARPVTSVGLDGTIGY